MNYWTDIIQYSSVLLWYNLGKCGCVFNYWLGVCVFMCVCVCVSVCVECGVCVWVCVWCVCVWCVCVWCVKCVCDVWSVCVCVCPFNLQLVNAISQIIFALYRCHHLIIISNKLSPVVDPVEGSRFGSRYMQRSFSFHSVVAG